DSTGVATISPFWAWVRPSSSAMLTASGPSSTHTMMARSKYRKATISVGVWPACRKEVLFIVGFSGQGFAVGFGLNVQDARGFGREQPQFAVQAAPTRGRRARVGPSPGRFP